MPPTAAETVKTPIWWSNGAFFVGVHVSAVAGMWYLPPARATRQTLLLAVFLWQAASMGITVGYHRLYSHRAFRAALPVRMFLAVLGASAFQGSVKVRGCLRHRLHHRFTDDPRDDPYAATKGLLWSHMGWIFFKSQYDRMKTIESKDLDSDIVVRIQHKYYVPLALLTGFVLPPAIGLLWRDPLGAFIYAGLVSRLLIWHCTFLVNSLAHWDGLQPYSDDNTSKSNLLLALLTCGEGNHNFHSFPQDFRSGPSLLDWDPSKWAIILLHLLGLASGLRRARVEDISAAREHMLQKEIALVYSTDSTTDLEEQDDGWSGETWTKERLAEYAGADGRCVLLLRGYVVDVTDYMIEHPGGASLLSRYAIGEKRSTGNHGDGEEESEESRQRTADWAFHGGINKHSQAAKRLMRRLRIAKLQ
ncbi:hypothetical protein L226DRAFT_541675 [Lentinus tigrinus ALCF2SS1-7]|uniref:uncharacterized protein n=1 Tax=Lentinus tigrinus ALCF2SS1-7 TaxID=1328758 RepID=UPI0011662173|nr:hypothetical protein L226DRAFT_541675 [Lentinus tigrinus ALCF2SS1-7]